MYNEVCDGMNAESIMTAAGRSRLAAELNREANMERGNRNREEEKIPAQ